MGVLANWDRYIQLQGLSMLAAPAQASGNDRKGASLCENVRKPRMRRMVFLYSLLPIAPAKFLVFKLTKSRRTFYAHDERLSFRTASGMKSCSRRQAECRLLYRGQCQASP